MDDTIYLNTHAQGKSFFSRNSESEQLHKFNMHIVKRSGTNGKIVDGRRVPHQ